MKKFWVIVLISAFSCTSWAQEETAFPQNEQIFEFSKPKCTDKAFEARAFETIQSYLKQKPEAFSINKRMKALKLKGIKGFEEVSPINFGPKEDYNTANALMMVKINKKIEQEDILLCKQTGTAKNPIYILAHPYFDNIKAYVINLDRNSTNYEDISFIYP